MGTTVASDRAISADFPFTSHYVKIYGARMHYVDEGSGEPILFLHGNPESSYIWRNVIPRLTALARCIAPDLIGMGKSDKPEIEYHFLDHAHYVEEFIRKMELNNITLVIHDWGSALGLYYAMRHEKNIRGIALMEAFLMPIERWDLFGSRDVQELFKAFRTPGIGWDLIVNQNVFIEGIPKGVVREITEKEMEHYREPFLNPESRKPLWRWPNEIPIEGRPPGVTEIVQNYNQWLRKTEIPKLLFYAKPGILVTASTVTWCKQHLKNLKVINIGPGIHYIQEDNPHLIGEQLATWYTDLH